MPFTWASWRGAHGFFCARVAESADAPDLKSVGELNPCASSSLASGIFYFVVCLVLRAKVAVLVYCQKKDAWGAGASLKTLIFFHQIHAFWVSLTGFFKFLRLKSVVLWKNFNAFYSYVVLATFKSTLEKYKNYHNSFNCNSLCLLTWFEIHANL